MGLRFYVVFRHFYIKKSLDRIKKIIYNMFNLIYYGGYYGN